MAIAHSMEGGNEFDRRNHDGWPGSKVEADAGRRLTPQRAVSFLAILLLYAAVGRWLSAPGNFWSPDMGARFAMIRSGLEQNRLAYPPMPAGAVQPDVRLHPLGFLTADNPVNGYIVSMPKGNAAIYPPLFPLLSLAGYRLFGFDGLTLAPLLGGIGAVFLIVMTAARLRLPAGPPVVAALGAATPLVLFASVFWDPILHVAITSLVLFCLLTALQRNAPLWAAAAGATVGCGLFFHELYFVLFAALVLPGVALLFRAPHRRLIIALAAGFLPPVLLWMAVNTMVYGAPGGPHFAGVTHLRQTAALGALLGPREIGMRLLVELFGTSQGYEPLALALCAAACLALVGGDHDVRRATPLLFVIFAALSTYSLRKAEWATGLFQASPLLLPCLGASFARRTSVLEEESRRELFLTWLGWGALLYTMAVVANPQTPGMDWGSRYLLPAYPLYALLALRTLEALRTEAQGRERHVFVAAVAVLAAAGLFAQVRGARQIRAAESFWAEITAQIRQAQQSVVVTDVWDAGAHLTPIVPPRQALLIAQTPERDTLLLETLDRVQAHEFLYAGTRFGLGHLTEAAAHRKRPFRIVERRKGGLLYVVFRNGP